MKRHTSSIEDILRRSLPSAPADRMEAALGRVFNRLRSDLASRDDAAIDLDVTQRSGRRWHVAVAAVAAAALFVLAVWGPALRNAITGVDAHAVVEAADGGLYRASGQSLRTGDRIDAGDALRTNGGTGAVVQLADGSRVEMRSQSALVLERVDDGVRIRLSGGGIIVNAAKQRSSHLYVQTKDLTVSVVGTVFLVNAEPEGSRVAVIEGEVRVQQGLTEQRLRPGEQASTNPKLETVPVTKALAWSREAGTLIALLQQATTSPTGQAPSEPRVAFEEISIRPSGTPPAPPRGARGGGEGLNTLPGPHGCVFDSFGYSHQIDPRRFAVFRTTLLHLAAYTIPLPLPMPERRPELRCGTLTEMGLLTGGPDWIRTDAWDVVATIPEGAFTSTPALADAVLQQMLRTMLAERFGWVVRRETREVPVYLLRVGEGGPTFNGSIPLTSDRWGGAQIVMRGPDGKPVPAADLPAPADGGVTIFGFGSSCGRGVSAACGGQLSARNLSMTGLANYLFGFDGRPVLDRTGLTGRYDFHYVEPGVQEAFARNISMSILEGSAGGGNPGGSLMRGALREIGLELEESTAPFDAWVIERAEKPTEN